MKINSFKTYKESMKVLIKEVQAKMFMKSKKIISEREIHQIFREKLISTTTDDKAENVLKTNFTETSTLSLIDKFKKMYEIFESLKEDLDAIDNDVSALCNN